MDAADGGNGAEDLDLGGAYRSSLPPDHQERIRAWHDAAYAGLRRRTGTSVVSLGMKLVVPGEVFPPAPMSELLGQAVLDEIRAGDRVLDMGTGSGINAILAASRVAPGSVVGVDRNPAAVACARGNAARNGVTALTTFRVSDVFDRVRGSFDVIVFDPPFRWFAPRDALEAAITDPGYDALSRFMGQARAFLRPGGRILMFFGTSGDLDYLHQLADRSGLARALVAERELERDGWTVRYVAYRLSAGGSEAGMEAES